MTCPTCGATVQPYDRFCVRCGHDLQPTAAGAGGTTNAGGTAYGTRASAGPTTGSPYESAESSGQSSPYMAPGQSQPSSYAPQGGSVRDDARRWVSGAPVVEDVRGDGARWASGSSAPAPNPYAAPPSTVSPGTMLNGRPASSGGKGGILSGIGVAIVAFFAILHSVGHAVLVGGLGILKLIFYIGLFHWLFGTGIVGPLVLAIIILAIVGGIWRARTT